MTKPRMNRQRSPSNRILLSPCPAPRRPRNLSPKLGPLRTTPSRTDLGTRGDDQPNWHRRAARDGIAYVTPAAVPATCHVQHGYLQAAICIDVVDEHLQKADDGHARCGPGGECYAGTAVIDGNETMELLLVICPVTPSGLL